MFRKRSGFTIVETMLSMVFISILMLGVGLVASQVINTYQRGVVIKAVNEVGYSIGEDIRSSFKASPAVRFNFGNCGDDPDLTLCYNNTSGYVIFCTGEYTYLMNGGYALYDFNNPVRRFIVDSHTNRPVRLVKVLDRERTFCAMSLDDINARVSTDPAMPSEQRAIELIKPSDLDLVVYEFAFHPGMRDDLSSRSIFRISFVLGTYANTGSVNGAIGCRPDGFDKYYCAINKFEVFATNKER